MYIYILACTCTCTCTCTCWKCLAPQSYDLTHTILYVYLFVFLSPHRSHPKTRREYENSPGGNSYLFATRKKELLSPVPESTSSGARLMEISPPGSQRGVMRTWGVAEGGGMMSSSMANARSLENISQGNSPVSRRRNYRETQVGMSNGRAHYRLVLMSCTCTCM